MPQILSVTPSQGSAAAATPVTIAGQNFSNQAPVRVRFGGVNATSTVVNDTTITAERAQALTGSQSADLPVDVTVTGAGGIGTTDERLHFDIAQPLVSAVSPPSGAAAGGTLVTIRGGNFFADATVMFGDLAGRDRAGGRSATELRAAAPEHAVALVDVTVRTAGDTRVGATAANASRSDRRLQSARLEIL